MKRPTTRTASLLVMATLWGAGAAIFFGEVEGGCVYHSPEPAETSVCNALAGYFQSCASVSSACNAAYVRDCAKVSAALSERVVNSIFACAEDGISCGDAASAVLSACAVKNLGENAPSEAQLQLQSDYCRACAPAETDCAVGFYLSTGPAGSGLTSLALAGDTTVVTVDSTCIPKLTTDAGTAACAATFSACAEPIAAAGFYVPPECVANAGTGDGG